MLSFIRVWVGLPYYIYRMLTLYHCCIYYNAMLRPRRSLVQSNYLCLFLPPPRLLSTGHGYPRFTILLTPSRPYCLTSAGCTTRKLRHCFPHRRWPRRDTALTHRRGTRRLELGMMLRDASNLPALRNMQKRAASCRRTPGVAYADDNRHRLCRHRRLHFAPE